MQLGLKQVATRLYSAARRAVTSSSASPADQPASKQDERLVSSYILSLTASSPPAPRILLPRPQTYPARGQQGESTRRIRFAMDGPAMRPPSLVASLTSVNATARSHETTPALALSDETRLDEVKTRSSDAVTTAEVPTIVVHTPDGRKTEPVYAAEKRTPSRAVRAQRPRPRGRERPLIPCGVPVRQQLAEQARARAEALALANRAGEVLAV